MMSHLAPRTSHLVLCSILLSVIPSGLAGCPGESPQINVKSYWGSECSFDDCSVEAVVEIDSTCCQSVVDFDENGNASWRSTAPAFITQNCPLPSREDCQNGFVCRDEIWSTDLSFDKVDGCGCTEWDGPNGISAEEACELWSNPDEPDDEDWPCCNGDEFDIPDNSPNQDGETPNDVMQAIENQFNGVDCAVFFEDSCEAGSPCGDTYSCPPTSAKPPEAPPVATPQTDRTLVVDGADSYLRVTQSGVVAVDAAVIGNATLDEDSLVVEDMLLSLSDFNFAGDSYNDWSLWLMAPVTYSTSSGTFAVGPNTHTDVKGAVTQSGEPRFFEIQRNSVLTGALDVVTGAWYLDYSGSEGSTSLTIHLEGSSTAITSP